ncbi:TetR/AcrR family transcriptional regulator [Paraglaciecola aquimarina]|uniref:TetR/AcrR family transcriptional regulator n=1 Tax=Paraglaciecola algarum TaxID=3050085 RepID=A0ABS9D2D3_9ALTE|nr:TetR/AcrR family transcriptional regulator [Paraglaciecola sp. G1-23]
MSKQTKNLNSKSNYHHGDLRSTLIAGANELLKETGIEGLSLRKLAEKTGVSRTAPYHHFKDKNQLLCAIAEQGFKHWQHNAEKIFNQTDLSLKEKYHQFFLGYIRYAADNPELYDLMFGRTIWKQNKATQNLRDVAYPSFNYQVQMTQDWQQQGLLPKGENTLRLSQVTWGTMHGIARLLIDGIYADQTHIDEMCECAVNLFTQGFSEVTDAI